MRQQPRYPGRTDKGKLNPTSPPAVALGRDGISADDVLGEEPPAVAQLGH